jgi:Domain of unknown function (DUF4145)
MKDAMMTGLEFVASLVESLAWPLTTVIIVLILKAPLSALLPGLKDFKYKDQGKDIQLSFKQELTEAERVARVIDILPSGPLIIENPLKSSPQNVIAEARQLVHSFPDAAVTLAWSAIEREMSASLEKLGITAKQSVSRDIQDLFDKGLFDSHTVDLVHRLRNLRNLAVHGYDTNWRVSEDEGIEFIALTEGLIEKIQTLSITR